MQEKPRPFSTTFFNWKELTTSILQGVIITAGTLCAYQFAIHQKADEATTRSVVFLTLLTANIFLTLVNRSFFYSIFTTIRYKNTLVPLIICVTIAVTISLIFIQPFALFFGFAKPGALLVMSSCLIGAISVLWYELVKWGKRGRQS